MTTMHKIGDKVIHLDGINQTHYIINCINKNGTIEITPIETKTVYSDDIRPLDFYTKEFTNLDGGWVISRSDFYDMFESICMDDVADEAMQDIVNDAVIETAQHFNLEINEISFNDENHSEVWWNALETLVLENGGYYY